MSPECLLWQALCVPTGTITWANQGKYGGKNSSSLGLGFSTHPCHERKRARRSTVCVSHKIKTKVILQHSVHLMKQFHPHCTVCLRAWQTCSNSERVKMTFLPCVCSARRLKFWLLNASLF